MKTLFLALIIGMSLTACTRPLTNDEIIVETQKCTNAGLAIRELHSISEETINIVCTVR